MKRCLLLLVLCLATAAVRAAAYRTADIPNVQLADRTRYTSNPDGILSAESVRRIDSLCAALRGQGIAQAAVVAVDDIVGDDVFDFAIELFRRWGVGRADADNGLGVLLVKERREIRFVTGGGLEGVLPDALCKRIQLEYMLPSFRESDYDAGMVAGMQAVAEVLTGGALDFGPEPDDDLSVWAVLALFAGFVLLPFAVAIALFVRRKRCPECRKLTLVQQGERLLSATLRSRTVEYTYVCSHCGAVVKRRSRSFRDDDGFGGGMGGGTLFGGGFGGGSVGGGSFGGGSFGGGGAGSRW